MEETRIDIRRKPSKGSLPNHVDILPDLPVRTHGGFHQYHRTKPHNCWLWSSLYCYRHRIEGCCLLLDDFRYWLQHEGTDLCSHGTIPQGHHSGCHWICCSGLC